MTASRRTMETAMPATTPDFLTPLGRQLRAFRASAVDACDPLFADAAARLIEARRLGWRRHARPDDLRLLRLWRDEIDDPTGD
jgi:hypothetical protein